MLNVDCVKWHAKKAEKVVTRSIPSIIVVVHTPFCETRCETRWNVFFFFFKEKKTWQSKVINLDSKRFPLNVFINLSSLRSARGSGRPVDLQKTQCIINWGDMKPRWVGVCGALLMFSAACGVIQSVSEEENNVLSISSNRSGLNGLSLRSVFRKLRARDFFHNCLFYHFITASLPLMGSLYDLSNTITAWLISGASPLLRTVIVCVREKERESVCACLCVCVPALVYLNSIK